MTTNTNTDPLDTPRASSWCYGCGYSHEDYARSDGPNFSLARHQHWRCRPHELGPLSMVHAALASELGWDGGQSMYAPEVVAASVQLLPRLIAAAEHSLELCVYELRRAGVSWAQVGELLGVTRQAAQQRYGR